MLTRRTVWYVGVQLEPTEQERACLAQYAALHGFHMFADPWEPDGKPGINVGDLVEDGWWAETQLEFHQKHALEVELHASMCTFARLLAAYMGVSPHDIYEYV